MPATPSTMLALGTPFPAFQLHDFNGQLFSTDSLRGAGAVLVAFICPHCPFVRHIRHGLARTAADYRARGLAAVAINSNDAAQFPEDGPDGMREEAFSIGYTFPYLYDENQTVAKQFRAACTPDLFLFDAAGRLAYRGQFDDSRPGKDVPVTGRDLRAAIDAVIGGRPVPAGQQPSIGCNIKWKPGHAPEYFAG